MENFWFLTLDDIVQASLEFDLVIFSSAHGFSGGGSISKIMKNKFTLDNYMASLLKSYLNQYINILRKFDLTNTDILLAGGIPQKLPVLKQYLEYQSLGNIFMQLSNIDGTLSGLSKIAGCYF